MYQSARIILLQCYTAGGAEIKGSSQTGTGIIHLQRGAVRDGELTVKSFVARTGTPNTVVYFGNSVTGLVFIGHTICCVLAVKNIGFDFKQDKKSSKLLKDK